MAIGIQMDVKDDIVIMLFSETVWSFDYTTFG